MLNDEQLLARIQGGEDSLTEFKPNGANDHELRKTLVAFSNTVPSGGIAVLFIGIANDKNVLGVGNPDKLQKNIRKLCTETCYPEITHTARALLVSEKSVLAVMISHSVERPHFAGPAYIRIGSESVQATRQVYATLIASRNEKAARILQHVGRDITVHCTGNLGAQYFRPRSSMANILVGTEPHAQDFTARLLGCDAFCVLLQNRHTGADSSFPLNWITIDWDVAKQCLKLRLFQV